MSKKIVVGLLTLGLMAGGAISCQTDTDRNVSGKVIEREIEVRYPKWKKKHRSSYKVQYELDIRDSDGEYHEIHVAKKVFDKCLNGADYPKCAD